MRPRPMMEVVRDYVSACDRRGWRPVFTREQFQAILSKLAPLQIEDKAARGHHVLDLAESGYATLFGILFTVSDNPRPPMPEEMLDRDSVIEEPERRQPKVDGFYGVVQRMFAGEITRETWLGWQRSPRNPQRKLE